MPGGAGGAGLPAPALNDVRVEDLKDTGRLLVLYDEAVLRGLVGGSEAGRLKFVAAAEHAKAVGTVNPCGLFARLVARGWWHFATQDDEDAASSRLKGHLYGGRGGAVGGGVGRRSGWGGKELSSDAELVREVRAEFVRARVFRDPFAEFARLNPGWTRERWESALCELGLVRGVS